jgi:ABC-type Fe3+-hydroxamate transport system substrate-binding protein
VIEAQENDTAREVPPSCSSPNVTSGRRAVHGYRHPMTDRHRERVVSLVPSVTETLTAWGRAPVACTRFCERPDLPHVGGTKDPDIGAIVDLDPDLVVVDSEENRREDYESLVARGIAVHCTRVRSVADVRPTFVALARILALDPPRWTTPPGLAPSRRAFVPIWRRPWMALGAPTYGASLLAHLGIETIFHDDGAYVTTTLDVATSRRPDLVIAPSEPYPFKSRHLAELAVVAPVVFVDGRDLFWWGERTAGAIDRLSNILR